MTTQKILKLIDVKIYQSKIGKSYIASKDEVLIGGLAFLNDWVLRSETSNALGKLFVRNVKTNVEEELNFVDEKVIVSFNLINTKR